MGKPESGEVTRLLQSWSRGDNTAIHLRGRPPETGSADFARLVASNDRSGTARLRRWLPLSRHA